MRKRIAPWVVIAPCLIVFSVLLIGNALASSKSVEDAVREVSEGKSAGVVIYEVDDSDDDDDDWDDWVMGPERRICLVSTSAAAEISAIYRTERITVANVEILVVYDASGRRLRQILGNTQKHCTFIRVRRTFFLPFDPHLS